MALFDIDSNNLVWQQMPVRLRMAIHYAWLKCLAAPRNWLYGVFKANRANNLYIIAHNGQVCKLEAVLNDTFDPVNRGIYITDGAALDPLFVYTVPEAKPLALGKRSEIGSTTYTNPRPLYTNNEVNSFGASFIINIPMAVAYDADRLKSLVNYYRLVGRTKYSIVTF